MIELRDEHSDDIPAIRKLNERAFGQDGEGRLVDALRANGGLLLSLVATTEGRVVGHPEFYPRFGFIPAGACGLSCEWEVPDEAFMILVLDHGKMEGVSGMARYRPEFSLVV